MPGVEVVAALARDASDACQGARDALGFFSAAQLKTDLQVEIRIQDALPPEVGPTAAGCFVQADRLILMRPYASFRKAGHWFGVPIDRRLYRSLAAHEVAHALATCNFALPHPGIVAKEYLAYVAMSSTMDPALRSRILKATPGRGTPDPDRLTPMLYMFDPMRFGIEAWRHHTGSPRGQAFLHEVLAGRALAD